MSHGLDAREDGSAPVPAPRSPHTPAAAGAGRLPLSLAQQRLWFLSRLGEFRAGYNMPRVVRISGPLDRTALTAALGDVVRRHAALRTVFPEVAGEPWQEVVAPGDVAGRFTVESAECAAGEVPGLVDLACRHEFDLTSELPVLARLFATGPTEHVLVLVVHHIAADGWSLGLVERDLGTAYAARLAGAGPVWPALPLEYPEHAVRQRAALGSEDDPQSLLSQQLDYWREELRGSPQELPLPRDRPRPPTAGPSPAGTVRFEVDADTHRALARLAREHRVTPFVALQTAFVALLNRLGAGTDIPIGAPVDGRTDEDLQELVGFFVNTLVFRVDCSGDPSFGELLKRVRRTALTAFAHQDVPFDRVVEAVNPVRTATGNPLFQVSFSLEADGDGGLVLPGLTVTEEPFGAGAAKFDLSLGLTEHREDGQPAGLSGVLEYAEDLFDRATVEALARRWQLLLAGALAEPARPVGELPVMDAAERQWLLDLGNGPEGVLPEVRPSAVERFAAQVAAAGDRTAVSDGTGTRLTYRQLDERAGRIAALLAEAGVRRGDRVGLCLGRSVDMVAAVLGVLRLGAAYVPVDPDYPPARLEFVLGDARVPIVLTDPGARDRVPDGPWRTLDVTRTTDAAAPAPVLPGPAELAYVIYTSGSTGRPKGVEVTHGNLAVLLASTQLLSDASDTDVWTLFHSLAFDFSVWEIWGPLAFGGHLVVVPREAGMDPDALHALLAREGVTVLSQTPSAFRQFVAREERHPLDALRLRMVVLGGEALDLATVGKWQRRYPADTTRLVNAYGATENTVLTTWRVMAPAGTGTATGTAAATTAGGNVSPIDGTIPGWRLVVLDARGEPSPTGVVGEIHVGGPGVARGYLARPALTAERYLPDPFGAEPGGRLYRTGDLGRWNAAGELEYCGRTDDQVKIRGFRIELGEVEAAIARHPSVQGVTVVVHESAPGDLRLVAYAACPDGAATHDLRDFAARHLPAHMVPAAVVVLDALPLTRNGKVDRAALPAPELSARSAGREPANATEAALCALFAEVLEVDRVGVEDAFFELGGHSLLVIRLVDRIRSALGVELSIRAVFEAATPAGLAALVDLGQQARPAVRPTARPDRLPLSFAQRRLWFLNELDGGAAYNIPYAARLSGALDVGALTAALADVVDRHESLRTVLPTEDGRPWQQVLTGRDARTELTVTDTTPDALDAELAEESQKVFRLTTEPALRARLFRLAPDQHVLLLVVHHVACDGWSLEPLLDDLAEAYAARRTGAAPARPPLPVQYADFTLWQRDLLGSEDDPASRLSQQTEYWRRALAGIPDQLALPFDRPRSGTVSLRGGEVAIEVGPALHAALTAVARAHDCTVFMALQAAVGVVLSRSGAGPDIPLGTATSGRADAVLDGLVGFFASTLVLRTDLSGDPTFTELLGRVRETDLGAYAHQDVPFETLVEALNPARVPGANPLFQVSVSMLNSISAELALPGLAVAPLDLSMGISAFDLSFVFGERPGADDAAGPATGLVAAIGYDADLFDHATVEGIADRLVLVLEAMAADPGRRVGEVELLSARERQRVLRDWNDTATEVPADTVPELFAARAAHTPAAPAVRYLDTELTYAELDARANRLAHELIARGIGPGRLVALALPRSEQVVVALLAVLKAGAAYLPVDPSYPADRVAFMLDDAAPACVLSTGEVAAALPGGPGLPVLALDDEAVRHSVADRPATAPADADRTAPLLPAHPAYVIYTSGSTGRPKGVVVSHRGIPSMVSAQAATLGVDGDSRVLQFASMSFDASVWDTWMALLTGGCLVVVPESDRVPGPALADFLRVHGITHATLPPAVVLATEFDEDVAGVTLITAGEACTPAVLDAARHFAKVVNAYGPTESTVCATVRTVDGVPQAVPIGRPVANTRVYVLDARQRPVPPGVPGELYLAGAGLATGYLNRPALTAERFLPDPFGTLGGGRLYRTGDLVRWTADGELVFLGRTDEQIKIRGFRVEPGEVEAVLTGHPEVAHAAVIAREDRPGDVRLVAYAVLADGQDPQDPQDPQDRDRAAALRRYAAEHLPEYLVPGDVVVLDRLPLTPSGKLDRKALPAPSADGPAANSPAGAGPAGGDAPDDPRVAVLVRLFAQELGLERVGPDDSFFELGGHSLLATRLTGRIRALLGAEIGIATLFESPTAAGLAARLDEAPTDPYANVIELRRGAASSRPVFCIHPIGGLSWCYSSVLPHLERDQPVYGIQVTESHGRFKAVESLDALARRYADLITATHPDGPYVVMGWSLGGVLSYEVARLLEASGRTVELVVLYDAWPYERPVTPEELDGDFAAWVTGEVIAGPSADEALDARQSRALVRAAKGVAALLGPPHPDGYHGRVLSIAAAKTVAERGSAAQAWQPYLTAAEHHVVDSDHDAMMTPVVMEQSGPLVTAALTALPALPGTPAPSGTEADRG
ncbi:amino acid adenylation domain-containing protein [Kitasatospora sp. NPDC048545]|uniref:amino acid adenylation domain-containing protein n=1 Tax=Kitasatospora sp. NPDC048545 TaxID=3157208 RepID=UPI0033E8C8E5